MVKNKNNFVYVLKFIGTASIIIINIDVLFQRVRSTNQRWFENILTPIGKNTIMLV